MSPSSDPTTDTPTTGTATDRLAVGGMSCGHCVRAVEAALGSVEGLEVRGVEIGHADVAVADARRRDDVLAAARVAVEAEGYTLA